jgi:hypothetical protein
MNNKKLFGDRNIDDSILQRMRELQQPPINSQLLEQARAISSQIETFRNYIGTDNQLQKQIAQLSRSLQVVQSVPFESIQRNLREMYTPLLEIKPLIPQINSTIKSFSESIEPLRIKLSENNQLFEHLRQATNLSYAETMAEAMRNHVSLLNGNQNFISQIRENLISYDSFAQNTLRTLSRINSSEINLALKGSLLLANEQTLRSGNLIEPILEEIRQFNTDTLLGGISSNRFQIQRNELLKRDDVEEEETYESLVIKSPAAISFDLIVNCLKIVGLCNEAALTTKGNGIFTLTNSVWANSFKLLQTVPTNKENFAEIVDYLYFLLIEGAGKDVLRFITYEDKNQYGYFSRTEPEVEIIWKIKHLRNKWLRHDIEHGKDKDIAKDYRIRKETLKWFGMQRVPQSSAEFIFLYNNLMLKVEEFLKNLLERISKFSD